MSELFTYKGDDERYFIKTKNKHYTGDEVVYLLNDLNDENELLRKDKEQLKERLRECGMRLDRFNCR